LPAFYQSRGKATDYWWDGNTTTVRTGNFTATIQHTTAANQYRNRNPATTTDKPRKYWSGRKHKYPTCAKYEYSPTTSH
jgi:hypothetical protein